MEEFDESSLDRLKVGILYFNEKKYWDCHEILEDPWYEAQGTQLRYIYWAIIQIAASLHHVQNKNIIGAVGMMKKAQEKIKWVEKYNLENKLLNQSLDWNKLKILVNDINTKSQLSDFNELLQFQFPV